MNPSERLYLLYIYIRKKAFPPRPLRLCLQAGITICPRNLLERWRELTHAAERWYVCVYTMLAASERRGAAENPASQKSLVMKIYIGAFAAHKCTMESIHSKALTVFFSSFLSMINRHSGENKPSICQYIYSLSRPSPAQSIYARKLYRLLKCGCPMARWKMWQRIKKVARKHW